MSEKTDIGILRELGKEYAEIAHLPIQQERVGLWEKLNGLRPERPMVMIDQLPINELATPGDGQLDILCEDKLLRGVEYAMRFDLMRWRNYGGDMVILPYVECPPAMSSTGGFRHLNSTTHLKLDETSDVSSQHYDDVIVDEDGLKKITDPVITHDAQETERRMGLLREIFDSILDVRQGGIVMSGNVWDSISILRGVGTMLEDMIDRPEFVHKLVDRMFWVYRSTYEQYERLGLLDARPKYVHCTGAFTKELPKAGFDGTARICDTWISTMAQMFSTVSPTMDKEFQLDYVEKYFGDAGLIYYGCCEPLHDRIHLIKRLPGVRKLSVSPWADVERSAEQLGGGIVMSRKPNPAYLAFETFDEDVIKKELNETIAACRRHGTPCELILKDVSTVRYKPDRLRRWNEIAMELALA
ncbi:MAG: hypothetical protein FWH01_02940 [Oscillospiraceae bacterium]|nr:hypothetical protein [Oscillospiraceae bacterium]